MKHTRGPWHQSHIGEQKFVRYSSSLNGDPLAINICELNTALEEYKANARLIAAAPEMFHLLNAVLPYVKAVGTNGYHWAELIESCIAKATGEKEAVS